MEEKGFDQEKVMYKWKYLRDMTVVKKIRWVLKKKKVFENEKLFGQEKVFLNDFLCAIENF